MPSVETILHPTDFSEDSQSAFETACSMARDYSARLVLLHVIPPASSPLVESPAVDPLVPAESQPAFGGSLSWPQSADSKVAIEHRVAEGNAAEEILGLAKALRCDLIVMGTHGRTGLRRLLTGSVAEEVLRKATCRVLAVKPTLAESQPELPEMVSQSGTIIDVRPLGGALHLAKTSTLARGGELEIIRLIVPAGKEIAEHRAKGALVVQCLEGRVAFTALGKTQNLQAGELVLLPAGEPHSVRGINDASLLLTRLLTRR